MSRYWFALGRENSRGRRPMEAITTEGRILGLGFGLLLLVGLGIALYFSIVAKQSDLAIWIGFPIMLVAGVVFFGATWIKGDRYNLAEHYRDGTMKNDGTDD